MKRLFLLVWIAATVAALADGEAKAPFEWSSFDLGDIKVMRQVAEDFLCGLGGGEVPGTGHVEYFVCRGRAFDALAPDLLAALDGCRAVCIGQYKSGGALHRVLYTVDDPPVRLGVFFLYFLFGTLQLDGEFRGLLTFLLGKVLYLLCEDIRPVD